MKINRLVIENFKSIERIELVEPNPFMVFVGPNGSGKSTIFEALEFFNLWNQTPFVTSLFGGQTAIVRRQKKDAKFAFSVDAQTFWSKHVDEMTSSEIEAPVYVDTPFNDADNKEYLQFHKGFARLFVGNDRLVKFKLNDDQRLSLSADNLEKVLKRVLTNSVLRDEIFEWLELFVPGFKAVEVDDRDELHWFENSSAEYFTRDLISDGTYNILALLTAVYQSDDKPQFLCIEEPENGIHPQVAGELVDFFRIMCEERGHYIWLNTHSQSMASRVRPNEFVVIEKKNGATTTKQFRNEDFNGMRVDEAWLTNALNGGLAW
jgi:predicted ATPase